MVLRFIKKITYILSSLGLLLLLLGYLLSSSAGYFLLDLASYKTILLSETIQIKRPTGWALLNTGEGTKLLKDGHILHLSTLGTGEPVEACSHKNKTHGEIIESSTLVSTSGVIWQQQKFSGGWTVLSQQNKNDRRACILF